MRRGTIGALPKFLFWRYLRGIFTLIPPEVAALLCSPAARLFSARAGLKRRITLLELRECGLLGDDDGEGIVGKAYFNHLAGQAKLAYLPEINPGNVQRNIPVSGLEYLDAALEKGKGAILLNPHFGPFMFVMPALGHRGYKLNQVALQGEPSIWTRKGIEKLTYEAKYRAIEMNMPVRFINAADSNMSIRDVLRALAHNEAVLFASTGRGGKSWADVGFLGRTARFNLVPFRVAARSGAPILPVFVYNSSPLAEVVLEAPLPASDGDPEKLLRAYVSSLEKHVKSRPDHFAFFLRDMRMNSWWDDHPFFSDYPNEGRLASR